MSRVTKMERVLVLKDGCTRSIEQLVVRAVRLQAHSSCCACPSIERKKLFMSLQMLLISHDNLGFKLDDSPPNPRTEPGASVLFDCTIQGGPMLFGSLRVSRQIGISAAGKAVVSADDSWQVDNVTLDGSNVDLTGGCVDPMRAARRVTLRATNIGKDPACFYGAWELHDIDPPDPRCLREQKTPTNEVTPLNKTRIYDACIRVSKDEHKDPDVHNALDREVRRIMQLDDDRATAEVTRMASNWLVEHGADLEGSDGISGTRTIALAYQARLAAITDDKRWIGEVGYLALLRRILDHGQRRTDRTGTGTISVFGAQLRFDLRDGFPLLTTKKVPFASIVRELLWFLRGSTNIHELGAPIWNEWADSDGDLGPIYGAQWRRWGANHEAWKTCPRPFYHDGPSGVDQISEALETIKNNPDSRRIIVSAWNVSDVPKMRLPPCHLLFQFYVQDGCLDCQLYQRSADMALGVPFNIASYALLTEMVAEECGLIARYFIHTFGDAHVYLNHVEGVRKQLERTPLELPRLVLADKPVLEQTFEDITLEGYQPHPPIRFEVSV